MGGMNTRRTLRLLPGVFKGKRIQDRGELFPLVTETGLLCR